MVGITAYGVSIPYYRIKKSEIHSQWQGFGPSPGGERTVANFDEDSLTLAVAASLDCMMGVVPGEVDAIFCASTTFPYKEKLSSAMAAKVLNMENDIRVADFCNSLRAGTIAMNAALDTVLAGSAKSVLVSTSDCRLGAPGGPLEQTIGDGGAAVLFGTKDLIAEVKERYSVSDEFSGMWRSEHDVFVRTWENRMVDDEGYSKIMHTSICKFLEQCGLSISDLDKVIFDAPEDLRRHGKLAKKLKINKEQLQNPFFETIGNTGTALGSMLLVAALDEAKPGDKILFACYGNGADLFLLEVTDGIEKVRNRGSFLRQLKRKSMIYNYNTYLRWRGLVPMEEARRPNLPPTSISNLHRNVDILLGLHGLKCKECGAVQYTQAGGFSSYVMPQRICIECGTKDYFEDYRFDNKKGSVFTYSKDNLAASMDPPVIVAIVDFDGGGRGAFEITDRSPLEIEVGIPVRMSFRHLFYDRGIHNYYWKAVPIRNDI